MIDEDFFPRITAAFDLSPLQVNHPHYYDIVKNILRRILPKDLFFEADEEDLKKQKERLHSMLPMTLSTPIQNLPANVSFFILAKYRPNAFKFFLEMIVNWLIPGKRLDLAMIVASDFRLPDLGQTIYTVCEVMVHVETLEELDQIQRNLPIIETEIRLGIESGFYARRILENKGLSVDAKTAMIQEYISYLIHRKAKDFDNDILTEMQHVLVICQDEFKAARTSRHLSRIISLQYVFRKRLLESIKKEPSKRHLSLKLFKTRIHLLQQDKVVLSVLVGINFLKDKELFEQKHILSAIQNYVPSAQVLENSFFVNRRGSENLCTLYLELEKKEGDPFTDEEIKLLRRELPVELQDRIEHLMHPIFMPRNEEEIMRNMLSLSNQIKYVADIPQISITFDEQTHANLFFTVILARVVKEGSVSIQEMFKSAESFLSYTHDRTKNLGVLRKKYHKEANVFRVKLSKEAFLRRDHSINLYEARQAVALELFRVVGDFRDYNGGMISKQGELLCTVKDLLGEGIKFKDLLLENFFYSLTPVIMRTVLEPEALCSLFVLLLDCIEETGADDEHALLKIQSDAAFVFVIIKSQDRSFKEDLNRALNKFHLHSPELANAYIQIYDYHYVGYVYRSDDPEKQKQFAQTVQQSMSHWQHKKALI